MKTVELAEKDAIDQKNAKSENSRVGDFAEKNAKRIHILETVELANFAEKNAKIMKILKEREFECCC